MNRSVEQNTEIDPDRYRQLIFDRGARQCSGVKIVFSQMVLKQLTFTFKKNESSQTLRPNKNQL